MRSTGLKPFLLILLLLPGTGLASEVETYFGLASGFAVREQQDPANDHVDDGQKIYLGIRFLGPIGLEFAKYNLGKYENETMEVTAYGADIVFNIDIRGMSVFAKGGIIGWEETDMATGAVDKGQDTTFGFGINLAVDRHVLFRTEIERFRKVGKDDTTGDPGTEMTMLSFGVNFRF